ncbi:SpaA isopeptide-forming pilin-related protein [Clostridium tertium]|uniref:SpaA isopeptide-forming pilin-related protein n=1 Tax=Clostridium tertium TaxID=1559 RepID=UPI00374F01C5
MRKLKRILSLVLTSCIFIGMGSDIKAQAQTIEEVAKLEIKVNGKGTVIVDDGYSEYSLEDKDVLRANATVNSDLKLTVTPDDGYLIASVSGVDSQLGESENSKIYNVTTKSDGTFTDVNFEKETKKEVINDIKEEKVTETDANKEEIQIDNKVDKILNEYLQGIYDSKEGLNFRKELVAQHNLEEKVDDNFFFKDKYLDELIDFEDIGDCIVLVDISKKDLALEYLQDENVAPILETFINSIYIRTRLRRTLPFVSAKTGMTVTNHGNLTYYENGILMGRGDMFSINGRIAFCADHSKVSPSTGVRILSTSVETNSNIRKILYYGFGGPSQISGWDSNGLRIATAMAISEVRHGDGRNLGKRLLNQVSGLPEPPSSFTAYIADTEGSSYQDLAFWMYSPKGSLQISKESADPSITNGNNCYSVVGAEYGVYTNSNVTGQVATLVIGSNNWSQVIDLDAGNYYIRETKPPKGYALDNQIYSITVNAGSKTTKTFKDKPQTDPVGVLLRKVDADTGNASPQGSGTLENAEFTFKFYAGEYNDGVNPADLGISPTRTWIMKTNSNGFVRLEDSYKVSGDAFWYTSFGTPTLPAGTLTIQETKAPIGYKINSEMFVKKITTSGSGELVNTYNEPIIKEDSLNFVIKKVQSGTSTLIPNAKFKHILPDGSTEELTTGLNGEAIIRGLTQGTHRIVEFEAPEGYEVNRNEFVFEVKSDNTIKVISNTTNMGMSYSEFEGDGILIVNDDVNPFSIRLTKVNDKGAVLEGAEFTLYSDSACNNAIETQVSDGNGNLKFKNLRPGTKYYMKETKAPEGYRIPVDIFGRVHVYEIYVESTPVNNVFYYYIDGVKYTSNDTDSSKDVYLAGTKADREVNIKVVNIIGMKLPKTGSFLMIPLILVGIGLMSYSAFSNKKKVRDNKGE